MSEMASLRKVWWSGYRRTKWESAGQRKEEKAFQTQEPIHGRPAGRRKLKEGWGDVSTAASQKIRAEKKRWSWGRSTKSKLMSDVLVARRELNPDMSQSRGLGQWCLSSRGVPKNVHFSDTFEKAICNPDPCMKSRTGEGCSRTERKAKLYLSLAKGTDKILITSWKYNWEKILCGKWKPQSML